MTVMSSVDVPAMKKSLKGGSSKQKNQNKAPNCVIIFFFQKKYPDSKVRGERGKNTGNVSPEQTNYSRGKRLGLFN